jgi:superfamily II DNA or RNA helicase
VSRVDEVLNMTDESKWRQIHGQGDRRDVDVCKLLPQQETLANIVAVVRYHDLPDDELCAQLVDGPVTPRIVEYYRKNAQILGFLDSENRPTPSGRALVCLEPEQQIQRMAYAFEASELGRSWLDYQDCVQLEDLEASAAGSELPAFLAHYQEARGEEPHSPDTLDRRARTIRKWLGEFIKARKQLPLWDGERGPRSDAGSLPSPTPAVFERKLSGKVVEYLARGSSLVRIATAYFSLGGYVRVAAQLQAADMYLIIGNDERSGADVEFLLRQFAASLQQRYAELDIDIGARRQVIQKLHGQLVRGRVRVRHFEARKRQRLHAKVYIFDDDRAYLGSANLSHNGLASNIECGRVIREPAEVKYLTERFEEIFAESRSFNEPLMRAIEESWALWEPEDPRLVLLKILDALFGHVQPVDSRKYQLADYQDAIVATVLRRFESQARILLVAPTGIGKTVMGAYIAAVLRAREQINRVIVVSKNDSMREMWRDALRSFRIYNEDVRIYDLERASDGVGQQVNLAELFAGLGGDDLLIVDECHHFRREEAQRQAALLELLRGPQSHNMPKALLMTATPISTGLPNLQTLLDLVVPDEPPLNEVADIARHRGAVNVGLGQILNTFGEKHGAYIGLHLQGELQFFPKLDLRITSYRSDMDPIFEALVGMDFTLENQWGEGNVAELGDDDEDGSVTGRHGFISALIARRAESSLAALNVTLDRLTEGVLSRRIRPANPGRFNIHIAELQSLVEGIRAGRDQKFAALIRLLQRLEPGTKVIVFTEYRATADYLERELRTRFENLRIAKVTGDLDADARRKIFQAFAPLAQRVSQLPHTSYDLLVATDAISEGENLQDAEFVVNYDLSWTPLRLIQRIGRVNRFTKAPRKVLVRNFFPGTDAYERIVKLRGKLEDRSQQVLALSGIDYFAEGEQTPEWLAARSVAAVTQFYAKQAQTVTLDELIRNAGGELPGSRGPTQLWEASASDRRRARELPNGVQACASGSSPGLYLLLEANGQKISIWRDARSGNILSAPRPASHEQLLGKLEGMSARDETFDVVTLDHAIGELVSDWFTHSGYAADTEIYLIAAIHVFSKEAA